MENTVDISGVDKIKLLKALWSNMKPAHFILVNPEISPVFNEDKAEKAVKKIHRLFLR